MGIHHTEITKPRNRPTMYASYFGTAGRSLESDDRDALNCAFNRYPPTAAAQIAALTPRLSAAPQGARLTSRTLAGHATLRYALDQPGAARLDGVHITGH